MVVICFRLKDGRVSGLQAPAAQGAGSGPSGHCQVFSVFYIVNLC